MRRSSHFAFVCNGIIPALVLMFGFYTSVLFAADEPEIHVAISAEEIFIGESVDYQVEIRNSQNPTAPDVSSLKQNFDVVAKGDQSLNQSSIYIINGRKSEQHVFSHVYHYQLTPKTSGKLKIPPVNATVDGTNLKSGAIPLSVIEPEQQDLVIAEIEVSHPKVYPTQPFTVTFRVLVHPLPNDSARDPLAPLRNDPPHIQLNWIPNPAGLSADDPTQWLQSARAENHVGFRLNNVTSQGSIFDGPRAAVFHLPQSRQTRDGIDGDRIRYFVYELSRTFTPVKTGEYSFGPGVVKGTFVTAVEGNGYKGRRLVTVAPAVTVEVSEVPSPRPASYCGAIGEYSASASASPTNLRVGDPLTLTLELARGNQAGSLELVSAPDLSSVPALVSDFELIDKNPTGRIEGNVKKFAYSLRPKRSDISIPPLAISTFDPQSEQFNEIETAGIPLVVSEAVTLAPGDLVGNRTSAAPAAIKTRAQGIFQNITDPSELQDQRTSLVTWGEAAAGIWCTAGCLIAVVTFLRHRSSDARWVRRQQARSAANGRLTEARTLLARGQSTEALRQVRMAIVGFVADTRDRIAEGLTPTDVDVLLAEASVSSEDRSEVVNLLDSIESAAYGGSGSADVASTIVKASSLIARVAPRLERGA